MGDLWKTLQIQDNSEPSTEPAKRFTYACRVSRFVRDWQCEPHLNSPSTCKHCGADMECFHDGHPTGNAVKGGRLSLSMGCNPRQIDEMEKHLAMKGVPTKFVRHGTQKGFCIVESAAHEARIARAREMEVFNDGDKNGSRSDLSEDALAH